SATTTHFVIKADGNVGIGTTSPYGTLHVSTSGSGGAFGGAVATGADDFVIENSSTIGMTFLTSNTAATNIDFSDTDANARGRLAYNHSDDSFVVKTAATEALRIDSAGNVGIGTTSPYAPLSVVGSVNGYVGLFQTATDASLVGISVPGGIPTIEGLTAGLVANTFSINPNGGNVGIGTAGPDRKLDVLDASAPQLRLTNTDGSIFTDFQVAASTGDLTIDLNPNTTANDIFMTQTGGTTGVNLRVCEGSACPSVTINNGGNVLVENAVYFGNGFRIDQVVGTTTEIAVYGVTTTTTPIIIFDEF
ncbi:hypothetical protein ACFL6I_27545, partial [candidate division KSB1 bacterium]